MQKHPDEIKHLGVAYLLLSMAFTYQLPQAWKLAAAKNACGSWSDTCGSWGSDACDSEGIPFSTFAIHGATCGS
jgi:hypothetical protein